MEGRNIPLIIMLSAGTIVSVACLLYDFDMLTTLVIVFSTLVGFYLIGQIVKKIILTINKNAEERAALLQAAKEAEEAKAKAEAKATEKKESEIARETEETQDESLTEE